MLKVYDMFSGIGGFTLGFEQTNYFKTTAFAEIEPYPVKVLQKNYPNIENFGDVTKIKYTENQFDVIIGGFPCTDISIGSKTKTGLKGERSILWKEYFRAIGEIRPKYCIIENVWMLRQRGLAEVLQDLATIGYDASYTSIDTKYCGSPQRRRRVYILGVRDGIAPETDIFQLRERDTKTCATKLQSFKESLRWNFEEESERKEGFTSLANAVMNSEK